VIGRYRQLATDGRALELAARYERVRYPSRPHPSLHPERLAATAHLLGLTPANVERCRVLEVGCANGAHLLPMAAQLPGSTFVGVDVTASRIEEARAQAADLALANATFECCGFEELGDGEPFDYVLAHGLYSWIAPAARDALLALCRRRLAPGGIALVSYNTLPGWYMRRLAGGVLERFGGAGDATDAASSPGDLGAGRNLLAWMAEHAPDPAYATTLRRELDLVDEVSDSYLFHDHLAPTNDPSWFLDFVEHAGRHGLRYVGEARLYDMSPDRHPRSARDAVAAAAEGELLRSEQLMDLLEARCFRRTLLCHESERPRRDVTWERVVDLRFAVPVGVDATAGWGFGDEWEDLAAAVRATLAAGAPQSVSFGELEGSVPRSAGGERDGRERLGRVVLSALAQGWLFAVTRAWTLATRVDRRPCASPLARAQAALGLPWVTNQRHEPVTLAAADRSLLAHLDGRSDPVALALEVSTPGERRDEEFAPRLERLRAQALLV
jgi:SAM-dependent methyltransferase